MEEDLFDELYRYTSQTIAFLEHLFHSILTSIDIIDGRIQISVKQSLILFEDFQKKLETIFVYLLVFSLSIWTHQLSSSTRSTPF